MLLSLLATLLFASATLAQAPTPVLAINAGGSATGSFTADQAYSGGSALSTTAAINTSRAVNAAPQAVYQTQRYGSFTYTLPGLTPSAGYTVRLHFAETYYGLSNVGGGGVGKRQFNVAINGQSVLTNFDIYAAAGGENAAVIKQFPSAASASGTITLAFSVGNTDQPLLSGIEVLAGAPTPVLTSVAVSPASSILHTGATQTLSAVALDQYGNPLAAQPAFSWSVASGVGTISASGVYSAGPTPGSATVQAITGSVSGSASVSVSTGRIAGSGAALSSGQTVNLTALGPLDWAHWGLNGAQDKTSGEYNHKVASGSTPVGLISNYTGVGSAAAYNINGAVNFSWTNGTPTPSVTNASSVYVLGYNGLSITVPADTTPRTLTVFAGGYADYATLSAHLSDSSAADYTDSSFGYNKPGNLDGVNYSAAYTLTYQAASAGQTLTVTWTQTHSNASYAKAQLQAAALALTPSGTQILTQVVLFPASATIGTNSTQTLSATALDQSGTPLAPQPAFTWSVVSGVGTVSPSGVYSAGATPGTATVQATTGGVSATATLTVRVPVAGLFSTGVDASGNLLADGAADPHYSITSGPDGAGSAAHVTLSDRSPIPQYWLPDTSISKWVSPQADQNASPEPPGAYVYKTTFDLTSLDPSSVQLTGRMLVDDQVTDVRLNGVSLGRTAPYNTWTPLTITSGFQAGVNTLEFLVTNLNSSNNPSGLQVQLSGTGNARSAAPAPPTGLTATAGNASVALSWIAPAGTITSYNVKRATVSGGPYTTVSTPGAVTTTSYADPAPINGATYYYVVSAISAGGESDNSSQASVTVGSDTTAPVPLSAVVHGNAGTLTWTETGSPPVLDVLGGTVSVAISQQPQNPPTSFNWSIYVGSSLKDTAPNSGTAGPNGWRVTWSGNSPTTCTVYVPGNVNTSAGIGVYINTPTGVFAGNVSYVVPPRLSITGLSGGVVTISNIVTSGTTTTFIISRILATAETGGTLSGAAGAFTDSASPANVTAAFSGLNITIATTASPSLLTAKAGNANVTLNWSGVSGASSYNIYRGVSSSGPFTKLNTSIVSTATYTDSTASNGTTYYYYVTALSSNGESASSNIASAMPGSPTLAAPTLSAQGYNTVINGSTTPGITLTWTAVTGATQYDLYRSSSPGGEGTVSYKLNVAQNNSGTLYTTYSEAAPAGTTYYYQVVAVGPGGEGVLSNEASATVGAAALAAPLLKGTTSGTQTALTWSAVANAVSYNVYRNVTTGSYPGSLTLYKQGLTSTTLSETGLTTGTMYTYSVTAVNTGGEGTRSNQVPLTVGAAPLPATLIAATVRGDYAGGVTKFVLVQWDAVAGASSYDLYRSTSPGGEGATPVATGVGSAGVMISYNDGLDNATGKSTLPSNMTYYYQIAPVGLAGEGVLSSEVSATPNVALLPAVAGLQGTSSYAAVTLNWQSAVNALSYNVYRNSFLIATGVTTLTYTDSGTGPGSYNYQVAAVNKDGQGSLASLTVSPNDFSLLPSPLLITAAAGTTGTTGVGISRSGTLIGAPLTLSVSGTVPAGVTYTFFPYPVQGDTSLYVCVGAGVPVGTYNFTLVGAAPGSPSPLTHSIPVTLTVTAP